MAVCNYKRGEPPGRLTILWAEPGLAPHHSLLSTGPGPAWPPKPSLLSTGPRPARPTNPSLLLASPSLLLANPSHLLARPLTSIGQTPHFYWPDPSLLLARPLTSISQTLTSISQVRPRHAGPCRTVSGRVSTVPDRAMPILAVSACRPDTGTSLALQTTLGWGF